ncbi:hypothetical protein [Paenibacillus sp. RC84]|uniref:hypothetical protein n=1 Tax=Paenibacillus sp. RC84 TaxID=3156252 RepID=UPI003518277D
MSIDSVFKEIGVNCPYKAARHLGIRISGPEDMGCVVGAYIETLPGMYHIMLNAKVDLETQERACYELVKRHISHKGISVALNEDELNTTIKIRHRSIFKLFRPAEDQA